MCVKNRLIKAWSTKTLLALPLSQATLRTSTWLLRNGSQKAKITAAGQGRKCDAHQSKANC